MRKIADYVVFYKEKSGVIGYVKGDDISEVEQEYKKDTKLKHIVSAKLYGWADDYKLLKTLKEKK